jgi:hypothetical protein
MISHRCPRSVRVPAVKAERLQAQAEVAVRFASPRFESKTLFDLQGLQMHFDRAVVAALLLTDDRAPVQCASDVPFLDQQIGHEHIADDRKTPTIEEIRIRG